MFLPTEFDEGRSQYFSENQLQIFRDRAEKNYQLSYIGLVAFHFIQTLEAYTTAHLLDFDMDESLTLSPAVLPVAQASGLPTVQPGLSLTWRPQPRSGR